MRITRTALLVVVGAGVALTGCTSTGGVAGGPSGSASAPASASASASASTSASTPAAGGASSSSCLVGNWRTTAASMDAAAAGAILSASGGSGVGLAIDPQGKTVVDFGGAQPVVFQTKVADAEVKGQFGYGGKVNGAIRLPLTGTSGTWEPTGPVDWSSLTLTLELTTPVQVKVLDKAKVADYTGQSSTQTGNVVDTQPFLRRGTYSCSADTLKITPDTGNTGAGITWTLRRA
jgi:hypothetical protein